MLKEEKILQDREQLYSKIKFLKNDFKTLITVKSNIPGLDKSISIAYLIIDVFKKLLVSKFPCKEYSFESNDGPCFILGTDVEPISVKKQLIDIEEQHFLGRIVDLDVYDQNHSITREKMRKCYLCDRPAFVCMREKRHDLKSLLAYINQKVITYFSDNVSKLVDQSIMNELNVHPKFGLVTPYTNGCHQDMNYDLMVQAKQTIIPYLMKMYQAGWELKLDAIFSSIRMIGLEAEKAMFKSTHQVNAYKGLIFDFGILLAAYGYLTKHRLPLQQIFDLVKQISKDVLTDFLTSQHTFGYYAYKTYQITGARGEVYGGLPTVKKALHFLKQDFSEQHIKTLMYIITLSEDTVLLKRSKTIEHYYKIKDMFKQALQNDKNTIDSLNDYCFKNHLSFGGSADLFILTMFLHEIGL